jgi:hypothetical protein
VALFGGIRRGSALDDREALADFMDEEAEAFARSAVDDYARVRARQDADGLFAQPAFAAMLAKARAEAYPIALILVAETVEAALAPQAYDRAAQLHGLIAVAQAAFDRRPPPPPLTASAWNAARGEIVRWLSEVTLHPLRNPPKTTNEIVEAFAGPMLALMPIHDGLGRDDFPLLRGAMRATLAAIRERFMTAVNAAALAKALTGRA